MLQILQKGRYIMKRFLLFNVLLISGALVAYADIPNAGVGVVLQECENKVCIGNVLPHSSAKEKGLKIGDIIVEIDNMPVENLSLKEIQIKMIGKKDSNITIKVMRNEEYYLFCFKKTELVPYSFKLVRNCDIDKTLPVQIFKNGDRYNVKMKSQEQNLSCNVVYRKNGTQYIRKLNCRKAIEYDNYKDEYNYASSGNDVEIPTETWINFDKLVFNKYNIYSIWHSSPNQIVKDNKELQLAKTLNPPPPKNGTPCKMGSIIGVWRNGSCIVDMTRGMTKQEKEDYFRAKEFEEELENYLRNK